MTTYYTYRKTADDNVLPGQSVDFRAGKGYFLVGEPNYQTASKTVGYNEQLSGLKPGTGAVPPQSYYDALAAARADAGGGPAPTPSPPVADPDVSDPGIAATSTGTDAGQQGAADAANAATGPPAVNWEAMLAQYGLPTDVIDELNRIWAVNYLNPQLAFQIAQGYVRSTSWYTQTYPGIQAGINAGLFGDEQGYRGYQNQLNQVFQQYLGRSALPTEVEQYVAGGRSISQVATRFNADAIYGTLTDPLKGLFTDSELHAIANEQAGIDTAQGQILNTQANLALKVNSLYQDFFGRGVSRSELGTLFQNGLSPQDVAKQFATAENIQAMNPAVSALFTPDEIHQIALDQAGGVTPNGKQLGDLATLATQLNPLYHQYTGGGVSRDEVNGFYGSGKTVSQLAGEFQGNAYVQANKSDIQYVSGAFGDGQLSDQDLQALGQQATGLDTPQGAKLLAARDRALQRFQTVFNGVLAHPSLQRTNGRLAETGAPTPDLAA